MTKHRQINMDDFDKPILVGFHKIVSNLPIALWFKKINPITWSNFGSEISLWIENEV